MRYLIFLLFTASLIAGCRQENQTGNATSEPEMEMEPEEMDTSGNDADQEATKTETMSEQYLELEQLVNNNNLTEALSLSDELINSEGHNAFLLSHKSLIYSGMVNTTDDKSKIEEYTRQATHYANEALSLDDESKWSHLAMALAYAKNANLVNFSEKAGFSKLANEHSRKVLTIDPEEPVANYILGRFYYEIASLSGAAALMAKPIIGKEEIEKASFDLALSHLKKSLNKRPDRFTYVFFTAMAYSKMDNESEALKYFQKAKNLKPQSAEEKELHAEIDKQMRKAS